MSFTKAVGLTKGLAKSYRAVLEIVEALESVDNLDQTRRELERGVRENREDYDATVRDLEKIVKERTESLWILGTAKQDAVNIVAKAETEATEIRSKATDMAVQIEKDVAREMAILKSKMHLRSANHQREMEIWNEEEKTLKGQIEKLRSERDRIKERISSL